MCKIGLEVRKKRFYNFRGNQRNIMLSIRKIGALGRTYRHLNRYRQILGVLFKYGFGDLIDNLRIDEYLEIGLKMISRKRRPYLEKLTRAERIRMALEELGPTFVKLGQILSTRPDLVPLEFVKELSKLQDSLPPLPYEEIREIFRSEIGKFPEEIFLLVEKTPLATASIAQVHKAWSRDGEAIVVKVQRPGTRDIIEVDLEIMLHLAGLMERHLEEVEAFQPTKIVEEFARTLGREINFKIEATNIEHFSRQFLKDPTIYVPKVYREFSTDQILTMEFVPGIKSSAIEQLQEEGYNLQKIARRGAELILKQIFLHGFFHADPHPGNIFILPNELICYLDFGMMGRISEREREEFAELLIRVMRRDAPRVVQSVLKLTYFESEPNRNELERDITDFIDEHLYKSLKDFELGKALEQLLDILSRHRLTLKPNLYLMIKALATIEGLGRMLDKDFDINEYAEPFIQKIQLNRLNPKRIMVEMAESGSEFAGLLKDLPWELRDIIRQARAGKINIQFEHRGLNHMISVHDQISNRISFSIVLAALIIGSSLMVLSGLPPTWKGISIIGLIGFVAAGIMGFWLLISILKHGKL